MKKLIFISILTIILLMFLTSCSRPQDICGDGVCSLIEKSRDNCPMDCVAKIPDLSLSVSDFDQTVEARANLNIKYGIENMGTATAKYSTKFNLYRLVDGKEQPWSEYTISSDNYLDAYDKISDTANFWVGEEGAYRVKIETDVLNEKDSNIKDNKFVKDVTAVNAHFPDLLIEQDFGSLKYKFSSTIDYEGFYLGVNYGKEDYSSVQANYESDYEQAYVISTTYNKDVTKPFIDRMKSMSEYDQEEYEGRLFYVRENGNNDNSINIEVVWVSGDKVMTLYYYTSDDSKNLNLENLAKNYLVKYTSSISYDILCGNNQCNQRIWYFGIMEGGTIPLKNGNAVIYLQGINSDEKTANFTVDGIGYSMKQDEIFFYGGQEIQVSEVNKYTYTYSDYEDSSIRFIVSDKVVNGVLDNPSTISLRKSESGIFERNNVSYTITLQDFYDNYAYIQVRDENRKIEEGTTQLLGGIFVKFEAIDWAYKEYTNEYMTLNIGENYKTCPQDCQAQPVKSADEKIENAIPQAQIGAEVVTQ